MRNATATAREPAVEYLREAVLAWAGESDGPSPEEIRDRLQQLIERHGVTLPGSRSRFV
jgi:hypothetical protein